MKNLFISVFILTVASVISLQPAFTQGLLFETSWNTAVLKARQENKMIFVDFYASWCGPCVFMEKNVFTEEMVGANFNQNFISVRIDAENDELALVDLLKIEAYPTMIFFSPDQKVVYRHVGSLSSADLLAMGQRVQKMYSFGSNPSLDLMTQSDLKDYLTILKEQDFSKAKTIAEELLQNIKGADLQKDFNVFLMVNFVYDINNQHFQYFLNHLSNFEDQEQTISPYINSILDSIFNRAVAERNIDLIDQYASISTAFSIAFDAKKNDLDYYLLKGKANYYMGINQPGPGKSFYRQFVEKYYFNDAPGLFAALINWLDIMETEEDRITGLRWARQAYGQEKTFFTSYFLAHLLKEFNKTEALIYSKEALNLADSLDKKQWANEQIEELTRK